MMTLFTIIIAGVFVFAGIICYASCCAASRADRMSEEYWQLKIADQKLENLKNRKNDDII